MFFICKIYLLDQSSRNCVALKYFLYFQIFWGDCKSWTPTIFFCLSRLLIFFFFLDSNFRPSVHSHAGCSATFNYAICTFCVVHISRAIYFTRKEEHQGAADFGCFLARFCCSSNRGTAAVMLRSSSIQRSLSKVVLLAWKILFASQCDNFSSN